jgi:glycosyltransferase involved in cell wall biosynthesis
MKFSVYISSLNPNPEYLKQSLASCADFDEILLKVSYQPFETADSSTKRGEQLVSISDGDWLCPFADDDYFHRENLRKLFEFIKTEVEPDVDIVHFPCYQVPVRNGKDMIEEINLWGTGQADDSIFEESRMSAHTFFTRRVWDKIGLNLGDYAQDWVLVMRAYVRGYKFKYFPLPISYHRVRENSDFRRQFKHFDNDIVKLRAYVRSMA